MNILQGGTSTVNKLVRGIVVLTLSLLVAAGLSVSVASTASAHTQNMKVEVKCVDEGVYDVTYTLTYDRGVPNGDIFRRTGSTTFENGWSPSTWTDWTKVATATTSEGSQSWTIQLPGDTTVAPWEYSYVKWRDGYITQGDTRPEDLKGDCTPEDACPDLPGTQPPGTNCTPPTTDECSDLPGNQPPGAQCEPKSQTQTRRIHTGPNCKTGSSTTKYQERHRKQKYVAPDFVWGKWSKWKTVRATSSSVPAGVCTPKVKAYCVTKHYGEGVAMFLNRQATEPKRYRIVRSGHDRVVTVGAHKNRRVGLRGLRVGSVVKVKADGVMLARARVKDSCGTPPPPHTGQRVAAAG